jgi:hypothetical protein
MSLRDDTGPKGPKRPAPAGQPAKPPVVGVEKVTCACGHEAELELYPDRQDKFRAARRKNLTDRVCPPCRQKAHAELTAREQAAAAERRQARGGPTPRKERPARPVVERLPHGSAFAVSYDAGALKWNGKLTIPTPAGEKVFAAEASAVFKLLSALDTQYREWLAAQAPPTVP